MTMKYLSCGCIEFIWQENEPELEAAEDNDNACFDPDDEYLHLQDRIADGDAWAIVAEAMRN